MLGPTEGVMKSQPRRDFQVQSVARIGGGLVSAKQWIIHYGGSRRVYTRERGSGGVS